jgi:hypothetical protein
LNHGYTFRGPVFFDEFIPNHSALGSAENVGANPRRAGEVEKAEAKINKKKTYKVSIDDEIRRLLFSCIVLVGTKPS